MSTAPSRAPIPGGAWVPGLPAGETWHPPGRGGDGRRAVVLLGATGSIGENTLAVLRAHPGRLRLCAVAANKNWQKLVPVVREFSPGLVALSDESAAQEARHSGEFPASVRIAGGPEAMIEAATREEADIVLAAVVGTAALHPVLAAIEAKKAIALASKEVLVLAGPVVMEAARRHGVPLLPTDSEHNALFQCLQGIGPEDLSALILTASGGPFRDWPVEKLAAVRPEEALVHPNWSMGPKITVDSATMANKGLELIEAAHLFAVPAPKLSVVIHPTSLVHSFVQCVDGSLLAQLSPPSMTFPIQHALLYPQRAPAPEPPLDLAEPFALAFAPPSPERFSCLRLASEALRQGGAAPGVFNAANEVAVEAFLAHRLAFPGIAALIEETLTACGGLSGETLEALLEADAQARRRAADILQHGLTAGNGPARTFLS